MRGTGLYKPWGVKAGGYLGGRSCPRGIHVKDHQLLQRHVKPQVRSSQQSEPELIWSFLHSRKKPVAVTGDRAQAEDLVKSRSQQGGQVASLQQWSQQKKQGGLCASPSLCEGTQ